MVTYIFKNLLFMNDKLSIKYFYGTKHVTISNEQRCHNDKQRTRNVSIYPIKYFILFLFLLFGRNIQSVPDWNKEYVMKDSFT
jgi:hypothetical protein